MQAAEIRLILAAVLLGLWLSYLAFLVWNTARPQVRFDSGLQIAKTRYEVLSRSQFLATNVDISATVNDDGDVTDPEVLWADDGNVKIEIGKVNIREGLDNSHLEGHGPFLIPLERLKSGYRLAKVPETPGYPRHHAESEAMPPQERTQERVYHDTPETRAQERDIRQHYKK